MPQVGERKARKDGLAYAEFDGENWIEHPVGADTSTVSATSGSTDPGGLEVLGGGYKRNSYGQTYREGPRGGFQKVAGPTDSTVADYSKEFTGLNTALAGIDRVDKQLRNTKNIGPWGLFTNPKEYDTVVQSVKDLQLRLKEQPYNLGVLNGPDLSLLESIVANPAKLRSAAFRETIVPRLANLSSIIGDQYRQKAQSFDSVGGRHTALPPLYRAQDSQYKPAEWGHDGLVPALKKGGAPASKTQPAAAVGRVIDYDAKGNRVR